MKAIFMLLSLFVITVSNSHAQIVESNEAPFMAQVKLDYQFAIAGYQRALDQKFDFVLGRTEVIIVNFKDTDRHSKLLITIVSYDKDSNSLKGEITREDFRNNRSFAGRLNKTLFKHVLGNGTSVVKIRGQDPLSSGSFRFLFDF